MPTLPVVRSCGILSAITGPRATRGLVHRDGDDLLIADYETDLRVSAAIIDAYVMQLGIYASLPLRAIEESVPGWRRCSVGGRRRML